MQRRLLLVAVGLAALMGGCARSNNLSYTWVGLLIDGSTAAPLSLTGDGASKNQVYAIIRGNAHRAFPCGADGTTDVKGCFKLDDIPVSVVESTGQVVEQVPVFATYGGYDRFQGQLGGLAFVSSTEAPVLQDMQLFANIRLFPQSYQVPYQVLTSLGGRPVPNTQVTCQVMRGAANAYATDGANFLSNTDTLGNVASATSDGTGMAALPGPLVNGASYHCTGNQPDFEGHTLTGTLDFVAGVAAAQQTLALGSSPSPVLYAESADNEDPGVTLGASGKLTVTFNRPVEFVPGTADCQFASLSAPNTNGDSNTAGPLPATVANNGASEQVVASISADGLTVSLGFVSPTPPLDPGDLGSTVTFSGIFLRPKGADPADVFHIGSTAGAGTSACALGTAYGIPPSVVDVHTGTVSPTIRLF